MAEAELKIGNVQIELENVEKEVATVFEIGAKSQEAMSRRVLGVVYREIEDWDKPAKLHYEYGLL